MPSDRLSPDDPREWLNRARSNLLRAKMVLPGVYLEDLCFDAQQAAEKAIKALLIVRGVRFPHIHDLAGLLTLLEEAGEVLPPSVRASGGLTRFAVATRYPGITEPVTAEEHERAVATAEVVINWSAGRMRSD